MSLIKSATDQQSLRVAGKALADVLARASTTAVVGANLLDIEAVVIKTIAEYGAKPSFLGHEGYPSQSCLSVNDEVVHGIPRDYILQDGDLLGIDAGLWLNGVCTDAAVTVHIGTPMPADKRLLEVTKAALAAGIAAAKPFRRVGAISHAIQTVIEDAGYGVIRGLTGHGVGHAVWEDPEVPNMGSIHHGALLKPGMVIAIEPMVSIGTSGAIITDIDGWTIRTADGTNATQQEHTVLITDKGNEILTKLA